MSYGVDFVATKTKDGKYFGTPTNGWTWLGISILRKGSTDQGKIPEEEGQVIVKREAARWAREILHTDETYYELTEEQLLELSVDVVILVDEEGMCEPMKDRKALPGDYVPQIKEFKKTRHEHQDTTAV